MFLGVTRPEAEDIVQSALLRCYKAWERVVRANNQDAYVHRIVVNVYVSSMRRKAHTELPAEPQDQLFAAAGEVVPDPADNSGADLLTLLRRLPVDARTVVVLRVISDLSEKDTADVLGVPIGTVKSRLSRALKQLRQVELLTARCNEEEAHVRD